jgi:hypothetical protein
MFADGGQVTLLLKAMKSEDKSAAGRLLPLVYGELHRCRAVLNLDLPHFRCKAVPENLTSSIR